MLQFSIDLQTFGKKTFGVWASMFGVWPSTFGFWGFVVSCLGFDVWCLGSEVLSLWASVFGVWASTFGFWGFEVSGPGFVWGLDSEIWARGCEVLRLSFDAERLGANPDKIWT